MKAFVRKIAKVKKREIIKKAMGLVASGLAFRFGAVNLDPPSTSANHGQYTQRLETQYSHQKTETVYDNEKSTIDNEQSTIESQSVIRFRTGSGASIEIQKQPNQTPQALNSALAINVGSLGKSGLGPRAKADAKAHASRAGSIRLPRAEGYVPSQTYSRYNGNQARFGKPTVKASKNQFQPKDDGNNNPPPENGQCNASQ